ncbi:hypothetical protein DUT91_04365 [Phyllobacterium salinisoli]|uniref:RADC family protein n=1 Tax=Phyllobacterium salinisoli TaxID=1899321 RepID=A0A368K9U8_9HYPH|nr:hypothetical protein [Phyllobacterium salinisoli]RCS25182.1 hypothetical protein DUT91_04365 [Phyllobacterium salinisoli]
MRHFPYIGSGPYCYANSFAMMCGADAPSPQVIEFATSSPFGMQIVGGTLPFFDPYGWTPEAGFDAALDAMGWTSTVSKGGSEEDALARLKFALADGPVWIGPVEMGHLRHQPGMKGAIGADHYVVVLGVDDAYVRMHDPQGYPFALLPLADFITAWRAETLDYGEAYTMRTGFRRLRAVSEEETIRASLPAAIRWLSMEGVQHLPAGTLGNGAAAKALAAMIEGGCDEDLRGHLIHFAIRVGARRLADAATCLARIGLVEAAQIASKQAYLVGALQYPLTVGRDAEAAAILRNLAPRYERLLAMLRAANTSGNPAIEGSTISA